MKEVEFLLKDLERRKVRLWLDAGNLRFAAPAGVFEGELRSRVLAQKATIVAYLEGNTNIGTQSLVRIQPTSRNGELPASFSQEQLWILGRLEGPSATYNMAEIYRLGGCIDLDILEASLNDLVKRHEALRTTLVASGNQSH